MHTSIVIELNAGSVGAGVVLGSKRLPSALLYAHERSFLHSGDRWRTLRQVLRHLLHDGLTPLSKEGKVPKHIDHVLVGLSSTWSLKDLSLLEEEIGSAIGSKRGICVKDLLFVVSESINSLGLESMLVSTSGEYTEILPPSEFGQGRPEIINFGPEILSKHLSQELHLDIRLAESLLALYSQNVLTYRKFQEVKRIVEPLEIEWREKIAERYKATKVDRIHIIGHSAYLDLTKKICQEIFPQADVVFVPDEVLVCLASFSHSLLSTK